MGAYFQRARSALTVSTLLIFFLFFYISFLQRHVNNYDFWWHLATGKYIVDHKSLPQSDPFTYTSHEARTEGKSITLKGYWLAQIIFYGTYQRWDLKGIIVLRALLMALFLFFVFRTTKRQGLSCLPSLALVYVVFLLSMGYLGERPQLFVFLFFAVIMYLLEDFRITKSKQVFLIPFLMLILANMHPGYIVCILLISLYLFGEGLSLLLKKAGSRDTFRTLLIVWAAALVLSSVNPNGLKVLAVLFSSHLFTKGTSHIVEFMPPFLTYAKKFRSVDYSYVLLLLFSVGALRYLKRIGLTHLLVVCVFALMSFTATRYIIFYACAAAPVIARILLSGAEEKFLRRPFALLESKQGILSVIAFITGTFLLFSTIPSFARYEFRAETSFAAPKDAADFLMPLQLKGNMFNEYSFGGYLLWSLYPDKRVFIDGRGLEPEVYEEYNVVVTAGASQGRTWEGVLRKYNISYIITPPLAPRGEIFPLIEELLERDEWVLIYRDQLALVFLRNTDDNLQIIRQFSMDKAEALNTIIVQASARATKNRTNPYYLITLGKVFYKMGKPADAEKAFEMAYQRDPRNPVVTEWLQKLRDDSSQKKQ